MSTLEQIAPSPTLPRRRGKSAATKEIEQAIVEIVTERQPITVRGVCYALFNRKLSPDMGDQSTGKISRIMTGMRETGALDWTLIVDGNRAVSRWGRWSDADHIIETAVRTYRRNNWQDQPVVVELWSEKSTVGGVLRAVLDDLGVTFRVMKGFGSFTAVKQAAEDSLDLPHEHQGAVALYVGDWDPSGLFMSEVDLPARLTRYGSAWAFRRIAITRDDLDDLPHFDTNTKRGDARHNWYVENTTADPRKSWELDAMNPNDLRQRVRGEIEAYMDLDLWNHALTVEAVEQQSMREFHSEWAQRMSIGGAR